MILSLKALPSSILGIYGPDKSNLPARMRYLHPEAAESFLKMDASSRRPRVSDMLRSAESSLEALRTKRGVQKPAWSGHNYGFSIDLDVEDCMKRWGMSKLALDVFMETEGWYCHRRDHAMQIEAWHFNYFGKEANKYLAYQGQTRAPALERRILDTYGAHFVLFPEEVQLALKKLRFYSGEIDGILGVLSQQALRAFQRAWNLLETGTADEETQRSLAFVAADISVVA